MWLCVSPPAKATGTDGEPSSQLWSFDGLACCDRTADTRSRDVWRHWLVGQSSEVVGSILPLFRHRGRCSVCKSSRRSSDVATSASASKFVENVWRTKRRNSVFEGSNTNALCLEHDARTGCRKSLCGSINNRAFYVGREAVTRERNEKKSWHLIWAEENWIGRFWLAMLFNKAERVAIVLKSGTEERLLLLFLLLFDILWVWPWSHWRNATCLLLHKILLLNLLLQGVLANRFWKLCWRE